MIAKQIRKSQKDLDDAKAEFAELQKERINEAAEIRKLRSYYDDFRGWADEFDSAPLEIKRTILSRLIDRVEVGRKYAITIKFNMSYQQFLECDNTIEPRQEIGAWKTAARLHDVVRLAVAIVWGALLLQKSKETAYIIKAVPWWKSHSGGGHFF